MPEFTLYIDGKDAGEFHYYDAAVKAMEEKADQGSFFEIYKTYHNADTGEKHKSSRFFKTIVADKGNKNG